MNFGHQLDETGVEGLILFNRFYEPDIDERQPGTMVERSWLRLVTADAGKYKPVALRNPGSFRAGQLRENSPELANNVGYLVLSDKIVWPRSSQSRI
jgi:hypothetical protein